MRELRQENILVNAGLILALAACTPLLHRVPRSRGRKLLWHGVFVAGAALALTLVPDSIQDEIFSPGGVIMLGTLLPVYESVVAACSIGEADDKAWLQYWITSSTLSFSTEWMDNISAYLPSAGEHWYEFEFLFNLWLILPMTDGASLIYDVFTKPYLAPTCGKIQKRCEGWIGLVMALVNTSYLWIVWFVFMSLPEEARRFVVVALGTVYPIAASVAAIATNDEEQHKNHALPHWLTYWASFSLLFIVMDYAENFVGTIPGFYSLNVLATLYLFLPMFNGAEVVFRNVLVPLTGQYENMLMNDAYQVRLGMEKVIPTKERDRVFANTATIFLRDKIKEH
jgi:TB2/DP1, HVA22 family